jgi:CPA1 family monovalent cation:H+ antiporter
LVIGKIRKHVSDPLTDTSVSLICPFAAYLLAEELHGSGVLAVVVAGLLLGHKSPVLQSASSRIIERNTWATIQFVLENSVFLLLGLQAHRIFSALSRSTLPASRITLAATVVLVAVMVLRPVWVFPAIYIPRLMPEVAANEPRPPWTVPAVISWAGMRGVVTLAAVFVLPETTPHREVLVLIALVVTAGTLLVQGATLPMLVRRLGLRGPDPAEDALQEAGIYQRAATAGLARLDEVVVGLDAADVVDRVRQRTLDRANAAWERLGGGGETPSQTYARLRQEMLRAEREEVLRLRGAGTVPHEVLQRVLTVLDIEETILDRTTAEDLGGRDEELTVPARQAQGCAHLGQASLVPAPRTPTGCEECLRDGTAWVHLRLCMGCGHVGCCDSSPERHAQRHFQATEHPVMRSFETGEAWRWCFVDELIG